MASAGDEVEAEIEAMKRKGEKIDFSGDLAAVIPRALDEAKEGRLAAALESLLHLEKRTRLAGDGIATAKVVVAVAEACIAVRDLKELNAQIQILNKKRGQFKRSVVDLVHRCMAFAETLTARDEKVELITTLRSITEGKIFVEVERARLTRTLAAVYEGEGKVDLASETLQEVAVETYGSMEKAEKAEFLLEQVRLTLKQRDFIRMGILATKVNRKVLKEAGFESKRHRFFRLLLELHGQLRDARELANDYEAIAETALAEAARSGAPRDEVDEATRTWKDALARQVLFAAMSKYTDELSVTFHALLRSKPLEELPAFRQLLVLFTTDEIIPWPLPGDEGAEILAHPVFTGAGTGSSTLATAVVTPSGVTASSSSSSSSSSSAAAAAATDDSASSAPLASLAPGNSPADGAQWLAVLRRRVVQHNLRVVSKYYSRLRFSRLCELLQLDAAEAEKELAAVVSDRALWARIDRPAGLITFRPRKAADEVLSDWSSDLSKLLTLVERTTHLINKEYMMRNAKLAAASD